MSLSKISSASEKAELDVQDKLFHLVDNYENVVFNAGAGSGKTYALTECLKYIIKKHGDKLIHNNQKIMCITYTNVATDEIKERLGNSDLVVVSTIHERLWSLIKEYRKELLKIHVDKLNEEIQDLQFDLNDNQEIKQYNVYRELTAESKADFQSVAITNKKVFYEYYDKPAKEFKLGIGDVFSQYSDMLKNVANFKKIVNTIYRIENYNYCLEQIIIKNPKYDKVRYEDKYNDDILHRMIISHDTLLEYASKIVSAYDLLKRTIHDSYPYILIDEYQDTNKCVVEIMRDIDNHAIDIDRDLFIGYFGDSAQNIYEEGVGSGLGDIHSDLIDITKQFNRRSHSEIIDVINNIRNDKVKQKSIFDDCTGGSVKFYTGLDEEKHQFIDKYNNEWEINSDNKLHCLVLLNKHVAEFNGFLDIYNCFSGTAYYKKNYDRLNTELLSNDLLKLGSIPSLCYAVLNFMVGLNDSERSLGSLLDKKNYSGLTFLELNKLFDLLKTLNGGTLGEYIQDVFDKYENADNSHYKEVIEGLLGLDSYSYQGFINYLLDELFLSIGNRKVDEFKIQLRELFDNEYSSKIGKKEFNIFSKKLNELIEGEVFSYLDIDEINEFKYKLHEFVKNKTVSKIDINEFLLKLDELFQDELLSVFDVDEVEIARTKLDDLLNVDCSQWALWYKFVKGDQSSDIIYHTYHGTKGAEFDNVIIIMQNDFGKMNKNKFSSFFENYDNANSLDEKGLEEFQNTKNLLYVSCSRAIKNLRILYLDDISKFKGGIEHMFGEVNQFN